MTHPRHCLVASLLLLAKCGDTTEILQPQSSCDMYCDLMATRCQRENLQFDSIPQCAEICASYALSGNIGDVSGATLQCRLTWAYAADVEPLPFCMFAGLSSTQCR